MRKKKVWMGDRKCEWQLAHTGFQLFSEVSQATGFKGLARS
jgi:hypothetical protein